MWLPVREAIRAVDAHEMLMLPPTYCTCLEICDLADPGDVLDAAPQRDLTPIEPEALVDEDGAYLSIPDRLVRLGEDVAARLRQPRDDRAAWAGGSFGERARCVLAPEPRHDDPGRHQHLGAARARRRAARWSIDPGPPTSRAPRRRRAVAPARWPSCC